MAERRNYTPISLYKPLRAPEKPAQPKRKTPQQANAGLRGSVTVTPAFEQKTPAEQREQELTDPAANRRRNPVARQSLSRREIQELERRGDIAAKSERAGLRSGMTRVGRGGMLTRAQRAQLGGVPSGADRARSFIENRLMAQQPNAADQQTFENQLAQDEQDRSFALGLRADSTRRRGQDLQERSDIRDTKTAGKELSAEQEMARQRNATVLATEGLRALGRQAGGDGASEQAGGVYISKPLGNLSNSEFDKASEFAVNTVKGIVEASGVDLPEGVESGVQRRFARAIRENPNLSAQEVTDVIAMDYLISQTENKDLAQIFMDDRGASLSPQAAYERLDNLITSADERIFGSVYGVSEGRQFDFSEVSGEGKKLLDDMIARRRQAILNSGDTESRRKLIQNETSQAARAVKALDNELNRLQSGKGLTAGADQTMGARARAREERLQSIPEQRAAIIQQVKSLNLSEEEMQNFYSMIEGDDS